MNIAISFIVGLFNAFVIMKLWNWFAAPLGVPAIGWLHAYGLNLLINLIVMQPSPDMLKWTKAERMHVTLLTGGLGVIMLLSGFIVHLIMGPMS